MKASYGRSALSTRLIFAVVGVLLAIASGWVENRVSDPPEIALKIDEPWEDMRKRSSAEIGRFFPNSHWFQVPKSNARLRFIDPQYGFTTPVAKFFTVGFSHDRTRNVRMSPQTEPLLLDDALKVLLDLQCQLISRGWVNIFPDDNPLFADTPAWRTQLRNVYKGGVTYWQAGDKYQIVLQMHRFKWSRKPTEERYLITLGLAAPWISH